MRSDLGSNYLPILVLKHLSNQVKIVLTTATMTPISRKFVEKLEEKQDFLNVELKKEELTLKNVKQFFIKTEKHNRTVVLQSFIEKIAAQNILIFGNTKKALFQLQNELNSLGHKTILITSNRTNSGMNNFEHAQNNQKMIQEFMQGKHRIMLSTNLLARGIDMRKVNVVVILEMPRKFLAKQYVGDDTIYPDCETYLHRVGRTGRYGDQGIALNFVSNPEDEKIFEQIVDFYKITTQEVKMDSLETLNQQLEQIDNFNKVKRDELEENI